MATDTPQNQIRVRNYLKENKVGPVGVILMSDLTYLQANTYENYFDVFINKDLLRGLELAKGEPCEKQFSNLYHSLLELNEKRNQFEATNKQLSDLLMTLFTTLKGNILTEDKMQINFVAIKEILMQHKNDYHIYYATHRGIKGAIDTGLTVLASLVIFYPATYAVQKYTGSTYLFFQTDTKTKLDNALQSAEEIMTEEQEAFNMC